MFSCGAIVATTASLLTRSAARTTAAISSSTRVRGRGAGDVAVGSVGWDTTLLAARGGAGAGHPFVPTIDAVDARPGSGRRTAEGARRRGDQVVGDLRQDGGDV